MNIIKCTVPFWDFSTGLHYSPNQSSPIKVPLTLAIAGGMVSTSAGGGFTENLVHMLKDDLGKGLTDESGTTVEERIIGASIKMTKNHKDAKVIEAVFNEFGA